MFPSKQPWKRQLSLRLSQKLLTNQVPIRCLTHIIFPKALTMSQWQQRSQTVGTVKDDAVWIVISRTHWLTWCLSITYRNRTVRPILDIAPNVLNICVYVSFYDDKCTSLCWWIGERGERIARLINTGQYVNARIMLYTDSPWRFEMNLISVIFNEIL